MHGSPKDIRFLIGLQDRCESGYDRGYSQCGHVWTNWHQHRDIDQSLCDPRLVPHLELALDSRLRDDGCMADMSAQ